jgi:hypothetical protein
MSFALPPILKLAESLTAEIELAVGTFSRAHRHSFGDELRKQARSVLRLVNRAWRDKANQVELVAALVWEVDNLKLELQLGQRLRAFRSLGQFEALARSAKELGKQTGGWNRQHHPKGQNAASTGQRQRSQILSTPAASRYEANR